MHRSRHLIKYMNMQIIVKYIEKQVKPILLIFDLIDRLFVLQVFSLMFYLYQVHWKLRKN